MTVVKNNRYTLEFVKEQTSGICISAVQNNGCALKIVKEHTS